MRLVKDEDGATYDGQSKAERTGSGRFAMIPDAVFAVGDAYAVAVYAVLARHANAQRESFPSAALIGQTLGISRPTVDRAIRKLIAAGVISKERRYEGGMNTSNLYRLAKTPEPQCVTTLPTSVTTDEPVRNVVANGRKPRYAEQEPKELESKRDDPFPSDEPPLLSAMRVALCEARGITSLSGKFKADMDAVCRDLLNAGAVPVDVPHLTAWAKHHDFWGDAHGTKTSKGYSLKQLPTIYEQWTSAGQPKQRRSVFSNVAPEAR